MKAEREEEMDLSRWCVGGGKISCEASYLLSAPLDTFQRWTEVRQAARFHFLCSSGNKEDIRRE